MTDYDRCLLAAGLVLLPWALGVMRPEPVG